MLEPLVIASTYNTREKRMVVEYDAIPATLRTAILTTEDRRFWTHRGVDYRGVARAVQRSDVYKRQSRDCSWRCRASSG